MRPRLPVIQRKSLLYRSGVEYADFSLNHVEGCAHGCSYPCYALAMSRRFGRVKSYGDWLKPKIVENALELLDKEIPKYKKDIKFVHLCFMTDPFMYGYSEISKLTLKIISRLNRDGIKCTILTKGSYPSALMNTGLYSKENEYGITLVSLSSGFKKRVEPGSAPFRKRVNSLKKLSKRGLKTWISMEPYPTPNIIKQNLGDILKTISFVDKIIFGKLNYNVQTSEFRENRNFYEDCAMTVKDFCRSNGIECHIKHGTETRYNLQTNKLFLSGSSAQLHKVMAV